MQTRKARATEDLRNPLVAWRKARNLNQGGLALAIGVGQAMISGVERGRLTTVPPTVLAGLEDLGMDTEQLQADYRAWRKLAGEEARATLLGGQAHG